MALGRREKGGRRDNDAGLPLLLDDPLRCKIQDVESSIAYKAKICGGGYSEAGVEEWGVFDGEAIEAGGPVFEHYD